jgi:RNA polymerase sigma factor (sigma-70 family)
VSPKQFALIEQRAARMVEWRSTAAVIGANDHNKTQSLGEVLPDHRHEEPTLRIERADFIAHVLNCLPPRYGMFISFYYLQGETMKRIGQRLDMSESRVSQLVTQSLRFARSVFAEAA